MAEHTAEHIESIDDAPEYNDGEWDRLSTVSSLSPLNLTPENTWSTNASLSVSLKNDQSQGRKTNTRATSPSPTLVEKSEKPKDEEPETMEEGDDADDIDSQYGFVADISTVAQIKKALVNHTNQINNIHSVISAFGDNLDDRLLHMNSLASKDREHEATSADLSKQVTYINDELKDIKARDLTSKVDWLTRTLSHLSATSSELANLLSISQDSIVKNETKAAQNNQNNLMTMEAKLSAVMEVFTKYLGILGKDVGALRKELESIRSSQDALAKKQETDWDAVRMELVPIRNMQDTLAKKLSGECAALHQQLVPIRSLQDTLAKKQQTDCEALRKELVPIRNMQDTLIEKQVINYATLRNDLGCVRSACTTLSKIQETGSAAFRRELQQTRSAQALLAKKQEQNQYMQSVFNDTQMKKNAEQSQAAKNTHTALEKFIQLQAQTNAQLRTSAVRDHGQVEIVAAKQAKTQSNLEKFQNGQLAINGTTGKILDVVQDALVAIKDTQSTSDAALRQIISAQRDELFGEVNTLKIVVEDFSRFKQTQKTTNATTDGKLDTLIDWLNSIQDQLVQTMDGKTKQAMDQMMAVQEILNHKIEEFSHVDKARVEAVKDCLRICMELKGRLERHIADSKDVTFKMTQGRHGSKDDNERLTRRIDAQCDRLDDLYMMLEAFKKRVLGDLESFKTSIDLLWEDLSKSEKRLDSRITSRVEQATMLEGYESAKGTKEEFQHVVDAVNDLERQALSTSDNVEILRKTVVKIQKRQEESDNSRKMDIKCLEEKTADLEVVAGMNQSVLDGTIGAHDLAIKSAQADITELKKRQEELSDESRTKSECLASIVNAISERVDVLSRDKNREEVECPQVAIPMVDDLDDTFSTTARSDSLQVKQMIEELNWQLKQCGDRCLQLDRQYNSLRAETREKLLSKEDLEETNQAWKNAYSAIICNTKYFPTIRSIATKHTQEKEKLARTAETVNRVYASTRQTVEAENKYTDDFNKRVDAINRWFTRVTSKSNELKEQLTKLTTTQAGHISSRNTGIAAQDTAIACLSAPTIAALNGQNTKIASLCSQTNQRPDAQDMGNAAEHTSLFATFSNQTNAMTTTMNADVDSVGKDYNAWRTATDAHVAKATAEMKTALDTALKDFQASSSAWRKDLENARISDLIHGLAQNAKQNLAAPFWIREKELLKRMQSVEDAAAARDADLRTELAAETKLLSRSFDVLDANLKNEFAHLSDCWHAQCNRSPRPSPDSSPDSDDPEDGDYERDIELLTHRLAELKAVVTSHSAELADSKAQNQRLQARVDDMVTLMQNQGFWVENDNNHNVPGDVPDAFKE